MQILTTIISSMTEEWLLGCGRAQIAINWSHSTVRVIGRIDSCLHASRIMCSRHIRVMTDNWLRKPILAGLWSLKRTLWCRNGSERRLCIKFLLHHHYWWPFASDVRFKCATLDIFASLDASLALQLSFFHLEPELWPLIDGQPTLPSIWQDGFSQILLFSVALVYIIRVEFTYVIDLRSFLQELSHFRFDHLSELFGLVTI